MISSIVDIAHALACHLIETGEAPEACAVVARALEVEPISELLYRDLIRAEHQRRRLDGVANAAQRLMISLEQIDAELEPETRELLDAPRQALTLRGVMTSSADFVEAQPQAGYCGAGGEQHSSPRQTSQGF